MLKRCTILLIIIFILCILLLVACSVAYTLEFNEDIYIIYLLEDSTLKPSVTIKPSNAEYVLVSSNPELVTVSDDGKSVKANYIDAMVTLTAMSGDLIDTALIYVYPERDYEPPDVPDELFHVRFDTFGWDSIPTQDIESNGLVTRPPYITYQNYGLGEWYTDKELTNVYDFSTPVTESFTLYAGWVETKTPIFTYGAVQENGGVLVTGIKYPLVEYGPIEIPEQNENGVPFVGIANAAFYKFDSTGARIDIKITSLTIPASIKQIGESAFQNCNYLTEIIFKGDGLEKIGINAFKNCAVLETLVIPQSANEISEGAFYGCAKFAPEIPLSVTVLDQDAYRGTAIVSLDLANVVYIHARSFKDCTKLDTISDPDMSKLQKIESDAFTGSSWINRKRVEVIGDSLNENKGMIFLGDVLLLCVKDPNSTHTSITVKIPENIKYIAGGAFPDTINNGFIKFSSETPPKIEAYAISTSVNLALVIPESDNVQATYQAYYTGITLTALRPKIVYKKVIDGLTMYVSNVPTTSNYYIYIQSYEPEETSKVFNLRKLLFDNFNSNVTIRKIKYGAFDPLSRDYGDLDTIILPPKILSMESNAFNGFSKLVLYIYGTEEEYGSHLPDSVQLFPGFIYGATSAVTIYVPNRNSGSSALVDIYREKWKSYVKSTSIKAEDLPTEWL